MDKGLILVLDFRRTLRELYVSAIPDTETMQVMSVFIPGRRILLSHIVNAMISDDWATQASHQKLCLWPSNLKIFR